MIASTASSRNEIVALVTGASSGIGAALCRRLVGEGAHVFGFARRKTRLEALATELGSAFVPVVGDMRVEADIIGAVKRAADGCSGRLWLVNNAGLGHAASLLDGDTAHWAEMLNVNVLGLCIASREAARAVTERGLSGHIVHISSMAAHRVPPGSGVYSATKYAVRSLTESLRMELWEKNLPIRVSAVSPAFVETEFAANYHRSEAKAVETYGQYKVLSADDVASSVLFALNQPDEVQVHDILVRPRRQQN